MMEQTKSAIIIGSGFAGLSAASFLAKSGWKVSVYEQHAEPGGRARRMIANGFTFDMGPSWYWMPDVFERYFAQFGKKVSDYYTLHRLNPSYRVYWPEDHWDIPANYIAMKALFEAIEPGAGSALDLVMEEAAFKYKVGMEKLVFKPGQSLFEFTDKEFWQGIFRLDVFTSVKKHFAKYFKNSKLRELLEFPVLFLGALAEDTPALYSLMNYADIKGGTWFPGGGMYQIVHAMHQLAEQLGVTFHFNSPVTSITIHDGVATGITANSVHVTADVVISAADYHFTETKLLPKAYRSYSAKYWDTRVMAPSALLYYVGIQKKLPDILHHSLFFDVPFAPHAQAIYTTPSWPEMPLFYVSATSVTDQTQAPEGCENLFFLVPVAAGLQGDDETLRSKYFDNIIERFEKRIGTTVKEHICYYKSFAIADFSEEYNAFKGNAYGLANTLLQTAVLKPSCKSKKVGNLYFTGQLTVPGPGVPPSLISGEVVAALVQKQWKTA